MGIDEDGQVVGYHTSTESGQDQVPVRMMELASEAETQKVRSLAVYQASEGLRYAGSTADVYKFTTDDGDDVFISYAKNGNFVGVQSQIHEGEGRIHTGHPPSQPLDVRPHTGGNQIPEPADITSVGGFPIHEGQPQIYITPTPDAKDLRDYILITPIPSLPAIYVYMQVKGKRTKNRLPEGKNGDLGPSDGILEKRNPETNELQQVRKYDSEGKPVKDIDYGHDHGAGDPHVHDWEYPSEFSPNKIRSNGRPLQPGETIND
nr:S-type pyocin domain-containing protein [Providencia stuartii]